jgi:zinc/manganese transport system substrate-binding protein/manganese/iron transport system substrate-binding protein
VSESRRASAAAALLGVAVALVLAIAFAAAGCGGASSAGPSGTVVVATTTQLADFARQVGGDDVTVISLLKPNVDPHDYEPTPEDLQRLATADVIVENGVGLERWFEPTIKAAEPTGAIVDASHGVALRRGTGPAASDFDPHIWQSPANARVMVRNIASALAAADTAHAADYAANAGRYDEKLAALDAHIRQELSGLANRKVVTNHDAFGYYFDRYGLDFVGSIIPSFDSQAELSANDVRDIVDAIEAQHVTAVFSESSLPPKTAEAIGREAGVKVVTGPDSLYGDTLGPAGSDASTYIGMMEHNTKVFVDNLG